MKKLWKSVLAVVMLCVILVSLAACGESEKSDRSEKRKMKKAVVGTWMCTDEDGERFGYKLEELDLADEETGERYGWVSLQEEGSGFSLANYYYHFISDTEIEIVRSAYATDGSGRSRYDVLTIGKEDGETVLISKEDGLVYYKVSE